MSARHNTQEVSKELIKQWVKDIVGHAMSYL